MSDKWYSKLKAFVPSWVLEGDEDKAKIESMFKGFAAGLQGAEDMIDSYIENTFISSSEEDYVLKHGTERSIERNDNEKLSSYRERVKLIVNNSNIKALKKLVESMVIAGEVTIIEHYNATGGFLNRGSFLNRNIIDISVERNAFTVIIENQTPEARLFMDRENFMDREEFIGSNGSIDSIFENIIKALNKNKAYGTVYRLIERN